ncbi:MAG: Uma2 family endonuclease [Myxococcales bacterium]|nr:Uma2 family endonuclease [Myxococcales bacterium]
MSPSQGATQPPDNYDHFLVLHDAHWSDYERALELRGQRSVPRISFFEGVLQYITPSIDHELTKSAVHRLIEAWCVKKNIGLTASSSWTLHNKEAQCGAEPDGGYVFDRGQETLNLQRPDVALEVIVTPGGLSPLEIYAHLNVPEIWIYTENRFTIYLRDPHNPAYKEMAKSHIVPDLDLNLLAQFITVRPLDQALRTFRAALDG